jgi:hypothetical protein
MMAMLTGFATATTADDGSFRVDGIRPGRYTVTATASGFVAPDAMAEGAAIEMPEGGGQVTKDVVMSAAGVIEGTVRDGKGAPVGAARVRTRPAPERGGRGFTGGMLRGALPGGGTKVVLTDADGKYRIDSVPGGEKQLVTAEADEFVPAESEPVEVASANAHRGPRVDRRRDLVGRVIDDRGGVVVGARLRIGHVDADAEAQASLNAWRADAMLEPRVVFSGDDGRFEINRVPPGRTLLKVEKDGYTVFYRRDLLVRADDVLDNQVVTLTKGETLSGVVKGEDGKPIAGVTVAATKQANPMRGGPGGGANAEPQASDGTVEPQLTDRTDDQGRFTIENVPPGSTYSVLVWFAQGYRGYAQQDEGAIKRANPTGARHRRRSRRRRRRGPVPDGTRGPAAGGHGSARDGRRSDAGPPGNGRSGHGRRHAAGPGDELTRGPVRPAPRERRLRAPGAPSGPGRRASAPCRGCPPSGVPTRALPMGRWRTLTPRRRDRRGRVPRVARRRGRRGRRRRRGRGSAGRHPGDRRAGAGRALASAEAARRQRLPGMEVARHGFGRVTGRVARFVAGQGETPLADVVLEVAASVDGHDLHAEGASAEDGTFTIAPVPAASGYVLRARHASYRDLVVGGLVVGDGRVTDAGTLLFGAPTTLAGAVVDGTGRPLSGALVSVEADRVRGGRIDLFRALRDLADGAGPLAQGRTAGDGTFALTGLPPGRYMVRVALGGYAGAFVSGVVVTADGDAAGVRVVLDPGAGFEDRVTDDAAARRRARPSSRAVPDRAARRVRAARGGAARTAAIASTRSPTRRPTSSRPSPPRAVRPPRDDKKVRTLDFALPGAGRVEAITDATTGAGGRRRGGARDGARRRRRRAHVGGRGRPRHFAFEHALPGPVVLLDARPEVPRGLVGYDAKAPRVVVAGQTLVLDLALPPGGIVRSTVRGETAGPSRSRRCRRGSRAARSTARSRC